MSRGNIEAGLPINFNQAGGDDCRVARDERNVFHFCGGYDGRIKDVVIESVVSGFGNDFRCVGDIQ